MLAVPQRWTKHENTTLTDHTGLVQNADVTIILLLGLTVHLGGKHRLHADWHQRDITRHNADVVIAGVPDLNNKRE